MIFGIGWHKTATHSLQEALNMLGFQGVHYPYELYRCFARPSDDVRRYLAKHQSATDFPVPLYFKELDRLYSRAKFVLTIREEQGWLASVEKHFYLMQVPRAEFGGVSENDYKIGQGLPIHEIHELAYGQKNFDAPLFLERYQRHNEEILAYFANRPDDLLVMDMSDGKEWRGLPSFLKVDTPQVSYPVKYRAVNRVAEVLS
jgi:hypothetical protein